MLQDYHLCFATAAENLDRNLFLFCFRRVCLWTLRNFHGQIFGDMLHILHGLASISAVVKKGGSCAAL